MRFEPMTIEHLGLRLYSTLPPVIAELVSNAHDAESPRAEVAIPKGELTSNSEVVVRDYGHGMTAEELQEEFLPIGRNRRGLDSSNVMSKHGKVRVTGRKGLGKLSAFGIASEIEVRSVASGEAICLRLNYDEMKRWVTEHVGQDYEPEVVAERSGATKDADGVEVRLRKFHRRRPISPDVVRRGLARRLRFIGASFQVTVNGTAVRPGDRVSRRSCVKGYSWDVGELPNVGVAAPGKEVTGWIGFLPSSAQTDRGVDIFASGKAVELGSHFNLSSTHAQFARAHVVGEIHADFLDADIDLAATARNSVVWESDLGSALQDWGQDALKWAFARWVELRRQNKEEEIVRVAGFDRWLATRPAREQRVAKRMVKLLVNDPQIEAASAVPLLELVKGSVETVAFRELVEAIEEEGAGAATLLRLFAEWRVIEAREHLKLADGRMAAIERLEAFMSEGALEVQQMQPLLEQNLWLLDQSWTEADGQTTYTQQLRKRFPEPRNLDDEDRRIDILGVRAGGGVCVVEIKRPEKTLERRALDQIADYVDWARTRFRGAGQTEPRYVSGLLIVGRLSSSAPVKEHMRRLAGDDIRVETYDEMRTRAREYYGQAEKSLAKIAPEYVRARRRAIGASPSPTKRRSKKK